MSILGISAQKLLTTETRVAIFIVLLFNNKNLRYLCLVLFSETHWKSSGTESAIIHPRDVARPKKKQWNFGELFMCLWKNQNWTGPYLAEHKVMRILLLQRYYWDRYEMSGLKRGVRIIDR